MAFIGQSVLAPAVHATVLQCGDEISTPGVTIVLTADVGSAASPCTTDDAILIDADNVTLDLNGHTVWGDGQKPPDRFARIGIYSTSLSTFPPSGGNNVTIKNGAVTGFDTGIYLESVTGDVITGMNVHDNIGPDFTGIQDEGIQVYLGGNNTISGNRVTHNGTAAGIDVFGPSNGNVITGNSVNDNNILDTSGHHGGGPIMQDIGVWIVNLSTNPADTTTNNVVSANQISNNGLDGVQIANYTHGNSVTSNQVTGNGFGQPAGNGFRGGDGIAIFGSNNTVATNSVVHNGANGIGVNSSTAVNGNHNTIRNNSSLQNGTRPNVAGIGFDLFDKNAGCDSNVWQANQYLTRNQPCIN